VLSNVMSQTGFLAITSQNFKGGNNLGVTLCQPVDFDGDKQEYSVLDEKADHVWESAYNSITIRFSGEKSPNVVADSELYPYLFTKKNRDNLLRSFGRDSVEYYSQALSFPTPTNDQITVLSKNAANGSGIYATDFELIKFIDKVAFCDLAFGGKDLCVFNSATIGLYRIPKKEGGFCNKRLFIPDPPVLIQGLVEKAVFDDDYMRRFLALDKPLPVIIGTPFPIYDQIALKCSELCKDRGIRDTNFGYDFSMRAEAVASMNKLFKGAFALDYNKKPTEGYLTCFKETTANVCSNFTDQLVWSLVDAILMGQVRGGAGIDKAISELNRSAYKTVGQKKKVENKLDYKKNNGGRSPDYRDALTGCYHMATRIGFHTETSEETPALPQRRSNAIQKA
jgi:hypothetical protein